MLVGALYATCSTGKMGHRVSVESVMVQDNTLIVSVSSMICLGDGSSDHFRLPKLLILHTERGSLK